jgi:putative DNA primase/helicase
LKAAESLTADNTTQAVQTVAREHSFHPIRTYLDSLQWDGIKRIDGWLTLYLGVDPSEYVRAVGAKWLIGGVARVLRPGCKVDTCPIFEGPQGALKSTALRTLAGGDFFTDDIAELGSKDSALQTRGVWIIELAELDSMTRGEVSRVKAFMSRQVDRIRPPYGRHVIEAKRECIFAGTTNSDIYLKDETGGRRFWPVRVGRIRIDELRRDRDQLWAEARERFRGKDIWWLDDKALVDAAADEQQARYEGDVWDEKITQWASNRESVSVSEVLEHCLAKPKKDWGRADEMRISRSLKSKGWIRKRGPEDGDGNRPYRYWRGPTAGDCLNLGDEVGTAASS